MAFNRASFAGWVTLLLRIGIGGVFIAGGIGKLLEPREEFLGLVRAFEILPNGFDVVYATLLPWVELIAGVFILLGLFRRYAAGIVLLMLLSFFIALLSTIPLASLDHALFV